MDNLLFDIKKPAPLKDSDKSETLRTPVTVFLFNEKRVRDSPELSLWSRVLFDSVKDIILFHYSHNGTPVPEKLKGQFAGVKSNQRKQRESDYLNRYHESLEWLLDKETKSVGSVVWVSKQLNFTKLNHLQYSLSYLNANGRLPNGSKVQASMLRKAVF